MAGLGTIKVGNSGITLSRRGQGVVLDMSFRELEVWAARNKIDERRLWTQSFGRACKGLRNKLQKVVSRAGGVEGVPKFKDFEDFTRRLREATHNTRPMGGVLADPHVIVAYKRGNTQYIGWPDRLAEWAVKFQDGEGSDAPFQSARTRLYWYRLGIKAVPHHYIHNPRPVLPEPFGSYVRKYLLDWAKHIFYKALARQMAKRQQQV